MISVKEPGVDREPKVPVLWIRVSSLDKYEVGKVHLICTGFGLYLSDKQIIISVVSRAVASGVKGGDNSPHCPGGPTKSRNFTI